MATISAPFDDASRMKTNTVAAEIRRMWIAAGAYTDMRITRAIRADLEGLANNLGRWMDRDSAAKLIEFITARVAS